MTPTVVAARIHLVDVGDVNAEPDVVVVDGRLLVFVEREMGRLNIITSKF